MSDLIPQAIGLLRFTTAGSVDDGKSSLIGRLLYDAGAVPDDQIAALKKLAQKNDSDELDLSLLTDGLSAEREQGITIDVAYRYFATLRRKFIIADTPGHEQYTRNMVTGASTADAAIILVDVRKGMTEQTRRHLYLAHLLGIPHLIVAINKMDLVDFQAEKFNAITVMTRHYAATIGAASPHFVPISAKHGDNVVHTSTHMPWYSGPTLLSLLEALPRALDLAQAPFRFPVQLVSRAPLSDGGQTRLYLGRIESGRIAVGDEVLVLPAGTRTKIQAISTFDKSLAIAHAPMSVRIEVTNDVDIARGDMLVLPTERPETKNKFTATLCWLSDEPHTWPARYLIKHGTRTMPAKLLELVHRININTVKEEFGVEQIARNDIACVRVQTATPLAFDSYNENRTTGSFILIDQETNSTVAAGMITPLNQPTGMIYEGENI